jgi:phage tail-like protein
MNAIPSTVRMTYLFRLEGDGVPIAHIKKANVPSVEVAVVENTHGGANHSQKHAGRRKYGTVTLEKTMPANGGDLWAYKWLSEVRAEDGTTQGAEVYKRNLVLLHLGNQDQVIDKWILKGCFPSKIDYGANDSSQDGEAMMETVELQCDSYERVPV